MKISDILRKKQPFFGLNLQEDELERLEKYSDLVFLNNDFLHLVAPMSLEEFAVYHILESLMMLEFLPFGTNFADIGAGAGLPSIPCLIVRKDLKAVLIEPRQKKSLFLHDTIKKLALENRAEIINKQFQEIKKPDVYFITCRALDKFSQKLPKLLKWGKDSNFILFGGDSLRETLKKHSINYKEKLLPLSRQRFLFFIEAETTVGKS
ncbi:MAG: hypothetical protein D6687_05925 [Acidobacteria bacterium]|jgi:16S rRNA (guanine(527)-N(7))-methyltransferase RsmG|nr:MAG: hypothetical protein D6687_05925 [Acidobacteriota bacterium]GIU82664.1 MAG: hypothetical protein KatS3mg006_1728 [Pyrinomonadaceae bacterium]